MHFWDGHRGAYYILAVETAWKDELSSLSLPAPSRSTEEQPKKHKRVEEEKAKEPWETEEMDKREWEQWRDWVDREREAKCTVEADVEVVAPLFAASKEGEEKPTKEKTRKESLRSILLSSSFSSSLSPLSPLSASSPPSPAAEPPKWLEISLFADDPDLKGFEDRFYGVGKGKANGNGFRRR
jgi:hypothetical protein